MSSDKELHKEKVSQQQQQNEIELLRYHLNCIQGFLKLLKTFKIQKINVIGIICYVI
jgi:hypothetical protein